MFNMMMTLAIRNLFKDKLISFINFSNLAIGFATFILISLFVYSGRNWDKHNVNYDRIYRLQLFMDQEENKVKHTWSVTAALGRQVLPKVPEIEKIAVMHDAGDNNKNGIFLSPDQKQQFQFRYGYYADQSIFDILSFDLLEGSKKNALVQPYSIVLSKSLAEVLFPGSSAIGKQVYVENKITCTVTGVYADLPENSTLKPSFLIPMHMFLLTNWTNFETDFWGYSFYTYVLLKKQADPASVDAKIYNALKDYRKEHHPYLRPMSMLHLNPFYDTSLLIVEAMLSFIAILILLLSAINYINLQTANASTRLREIGIKKTAGFSKRNLISQIVFESVALSFLAGLIGLLLAEIMLPVFNQIISGHAANHVYDNLPLMGLIILVIIITGLLSGLYPAWIISSYNPVDALKQKHAREVSKGIGLKQILVTAQFAISLFLLTISFIVYRQSMFMINNDPGFDSQHIIFSNIITDKQGTFEQLQARLREHPEIEEACVSDYIPYILPGGDDLTWEGGRQEERVFVRIYNVDKDFFNTYRIKVLQGRNFTNSDRNNRKVCLINETGARIFEWKQSLGMHINEYWGRVEVIGVVSDFVASSFHNPIEPHMYLLMPDTAPAKDKLLNDKVYSVRFAPGKYQEAMKIVNEEFGKFFSNDAFEFRHIQTRIQNEEAVKAWASFRNITLFFAVLSIIISSVGLFGLVMFFLKKKMKEIGIRKVLGFSLSHIYSKLSTQFLWFILLSLVFAWPLAYLVYKSLPGANKYSLQVWEFLLALGIILLVAIVTISYNLIKAVKTSPAEIFKYE